MTFDSQIIVMSENMTDNDIRIEPADTEEKYLGLRALWCDVFGDSPEYVDGVFECLGADIRGYVALDREDNVCSALTCYKCGRYEDMPVYVSYAVCTAEERRGQGIAGRLVSFVRDLILQGGGLPLISPAELSLEAFYSKLGYEPHFYVSERAVMSPEFDDEAYDDFDEYDLDFGEDSDAGAFEPGLSLEPLSINKYNRYREAYLTGRPHIELSGSMLELIRRESLNGNGLFEVNGGDAICVISETDPGQTVISELIINPLLLELSLDIDSEIASMIAAYFGSIEAVYRTPGYGRCQSMTAGLCMKKDLRHDVSAVSGKSIDDDEEQTYLFREAYYGFSLD